MLPDGGQHHDIEADRKVALDAQLWKLIIDPADRWIGVKALPLGAHTARRFNRNYVIALAGEPSGAASRPSADVEDRAGRLWEEIA